MKTTKFAILLVLSIVLMNSCQSNNRKAPSQEDVGEFTSAVEKVTNMLQPESASLIFTLDGVRYELDTKNVKPTFIPFTSFRPANEEEGDHEDQSIIWMQGKDKTNNNIEIHFETTLNQKITNGIFTTSNGSITIEKDGKNKYYQIQNLELKISNVSEKQFNEELSAYSLDMAFNGTIETVGSNGKAFEITDGKYEVKY